MPRAAVRLFAASESTYAWPGTRAAQVRRRGGSWEAAAWNECLLFIFVVPSLRRRQCLLTLAGGVVRFRRSRMHALGLPPPGLFAGPRCRKGSILDSHTPTLQALGTGRGPFCAAVSLWRTDPFLPCRGWSRDSVQHAEAAPILPAGRGGRLIALWWPGLLLLARGGRHLGGS